MPQQTQTSVIQYLTEAVTASEMAQSIKNILARLGNPTDDDAAVLKYFVDALEGKTF